MCLLVQQRSLQLRFQCREQHACHEGMTGEIGQRTVWFVCVCDLCVYRFPCVFVHVCVSVLWRLHAFLLFSASWWKTYWDIKQQGRAEPRSVSTSGLWLCDIHCQCFTLFYFLFVFQGAVRGIHEPLGQLCFKFGQPCPLWEQQPVAGHAVGGAAEAPSSGAIVWSFQGRPGSHEVVETLLQVSRRVQKVAERSRGVTLLRYCVMFHSLSQALCSLREVLYYYSSYWLYHSPLCCCSDEACTSGQLVIASRESQYKILHFHHAGLDKLAEVFQQWKCCRETQLKDQVGLQPKFPVWFLVLLEKEAFFLTVFIQL